MRLDATKTKEETMRMTAFPQPSSAHNGRYRWFWRLWANALGDDDVSGRAIIKTSPASYASQLDAMEAGAHAFADAIKP